MSKKVTIYDIAEKLKVSPSTVSRALAGNSLISAETKTKVMAAAVGMGYTDIRAVSNAHTIAVIVPEIDNFFYSKVLSTIQYTIKNKYLFSIFCSFNSSRIEREIVSKLNPDQIKCLIISQSMDTEDSSHLSDVEKKGIPVILFNRVNYNYASPKFLIDNYMDSFMLTNHLVSSGYRRIAFAAKHYNCPIYKERVQAYKDVLNKNNIAFNPDYLIYSEHTLEDTYEVITRFIHMRPRPDALILPNFVSALQATSIAKIYNISIPGEMAVVSFDEDPESKYSTPTITGIGRPCTEIGIEIGKFALSVCDNQPYDRNAIKIFPSNLIIRGSSLSHP
ncbi:LacI family DNA-binding transcriptional regulator [Proteiniphilum sp.]|uniref:LacI family DNA-binding transcriptional regulator n=1 Tax=Proteiniphilum sp. TaxID=1926877 RepID=UPI002B203E2F|nr:LacI family DNA-binding transcriptional regulator [Proteiniphilum sp.]MEA4917997.1 LacI family DNA-binding transcriptional regulator [Proteiniphilum sp.]